jgi:Flp pilus assembly protein TadD
MIVMLRTLAAALMLLGAGSHTIGQTSSSPRDRALAFDAANDTTRALATLDAGLKANPRDPGLLAAQGRIYWRLLRTNSAERALVEAAKAPAYAAEAQHWLGRIYFFKGYQAEGAFPGFHEEVSYRPRAIAAFQAARDAKPDWYLPHVGLGDAYKADGRDQEAADQYARASALGRPNPAPGADSVDADAVKAAQQASQWSTVIEKGRAFVAAHKSSPRLIEVYDALLAAYQSTPTAPVAEVRAAVDARVALRPDPMSYTLGANLLLARKADLAHVAQLADTGRAVGERFIRENESSYKLDGKVQGSLDRNQATFADIAGWAAYLQGNRALAEKRLAEAARLSRNLDATNQMHLGELSKGKNDLETARDHYLTVLGLAAVTPPQREAAKATLADIQTKSGENPAEFETWLTNTLARLREERRKALLSDMAGKPVPPLVLKDLQGNTVDLMAERGNVVLLNFFSAW